MATMPNPELEAMAGRLAAIRGQSIEEVVATALRAELAREPRKAVPVRPDELLPSQRSKVDRIMELVLAAGPADPVEGDRTAELYDDYGLPR